MEASTSGIVYAISILATRNEVFIAEDEDRETITTRSDIRHCPLLNVAETPEAARAWAEGIADEAMPSNEGWEHQVSVIPFCFTVAVAERAVGVFGVAVNISKVEDKIPE